MAGLFLASLLTACGFHLRGSLPSTAVSESYQLLNQTSEFAFSDKLNRRLDNLGLLSKADSDESIRLIIQSAEWLQRKLAIDALGRVVEWQMELQVVLVLKANKSAAGERITVKTRDSWSTDPDNALAASVDIAQVKAGVETRLVNRIVQLLFQRQGQDS